MQVVLNDILKEKTYPEAGTAFFQVIEQAICANEKLKIDMKDVDSIPTMFMTNSFGRIMDAYGVKKLKETMLFVHISKAQIERIRKYLNDYVETYNIVQ